MVQRFFQAKALRFDTNSDDAFGCRNPIRGAVVSPLELQMHRGLDESGALRHFPLGSIAMELRVPRSHFGVFGGKFWLSVYLFVYL
jgi:hypothetical protein